MLNIGKLRAGGENYYLNSVARGVEDYYLGSGEALGYWMASGSVHLGLAGEVGADELRNVLRGTHPTSGQQLAKSHKERVPGFDLTFRAPKSVALLRELGPKEASNEVVNAHDAAVAAALAYLERQASGARRGKGGRRSIASKGFIAAAFRHRTSRAGDPLLHTHVLVANLIEGEDGKWGALDAKHLYTHAKTAGYLYQAHLRAELTRRLGVEWTPVRKGAADIAGISRRVIRTFSTRREEIEEFLGESSEPTRREAELAALKTRQAKDYRVSPQRMLPRWKETADRLGLTPEVLESTLGRSYDKPIEAKKLTEIGSRLAAPEGLTAQASSFSRREVLQGFCSELQVGATVTDIEAMSDAFLASDLVLALSARAQGVTAAQSQRVSEGHVASSTQERRYSTPEMLAVEQDVIERAIERRLDGCGVVAPAVLEHALIRRPSLFADQRAMVTRLATSGLGVEVVVGKAGTGKTFALDAAREAWELSGRPVIGCALAARAAQELQSGSGIQSYTIDSLLLDLSDPECHGLPAGSILVVDEAGIVGTRKLARLMTHAGRADAKVVLVGDDRQLPEIEAGGAFRGIKNRLPAIELAEVRRQPFGWERDALDLLREGRAQQAMVEYDRHHRVHVGSSAEQTRKALVADWWATQDDPERGVMIAARRSDVADLNARARALMRADGRLGRNELELECGLFSVGDRIMTLKNYRRLGVINGTRATVVAIDPDRSEMRIRSGDGAEIKLPQWYLQEGHVTHAYAITGHKSQGMTTEQAFVLGDETLYREWAYVAMSRGKNVNSLYVVAGIDPERDEVGGQVARPDDPRAELMRALERSRAKDLALDVYEQDEIRNLTLTQLRREWESISQSLEDPPPDVQEELERVGAQRSPVEASIEREQDIARTARDELDGMGFVARRRDRAGVSRLEHRIADSAKVQSELLVERERLTQEETGLHDQAVARERWIVQNAPGIRRRYALERELWWREHQSALAAEVAMPTYLTNAVGERPDKPSERAAWRAAVHAIESYRARWAIRDEDRALGDEPADADQKRERDELSRRLGERQETQRSPEKEVEVIERSLEL
jgi:conjugative relaxase-like TrwC/TraI family protein